ncbi:acyl-CoA dehydrogenase, N-terminal domain protein [Mycobacterium xenopi 4042]|uniref:Acyl-CoA dehydrogenase, N-terminal domain protein n=1 Tax=Mycobacterium xenopi 4042 TaxID=1299334 RepID=X7Z2W4_MYCXE|nr:acyl-CoA dehydrogenase, N-terminal domain protein [Mycobacterium xenopi 4042]EUA33706.1 acyl-CoA dehydrogenase, N-terminal domain protein [Mycobacterium xenopi 3993]
MDFTLPEHLPRLLAEMDAFIEAEIAPLQAEHMQYFDHRREFARTDLDNGGIPRRAWEDLLDEMRRRADKAGWLRYGLPSSLGGRDGTNLDMAVIREHLAHKGIGLHNDLQNESSIVGNFPQVIMIERFGTDEQRREWSEALITGKRSMAFGLTEPQHGSDATWLETRAKRDGDDWVINGAKRWNTGVHRATHDLIFARTSGEPGQATGITAFLVPTDAPASRCRSTGGLSTCPPTTAKSNCGTCGCPPTRCSAKSTAAWTLRRRSCTKTGFGKRPAASAQRSTALTAPPSTPASEQCSANRCRSTRPCNGRWPNCRPKPRWCGCWCTTPLGI